jgi:hypothetical protein
MSKLVTNIKYQNYWLSVIREGNTPLMNYSSWHLINEDGQKLNLNWMPEDILGRTKHINWNIFYYLPDPGRMGSTLRSKEFFRSLLDE